MKLNDVISIQINHEVLADHVFENSVKPMLTKLAEKIPGSIATAVLEKNEAFLLDQFKTLFSNSVKELERKTKVDLDGDGKIA